MQNLTAASFPTANWFTANFPRTNDHTEQAPKHSQKRCFGDVLLSKGGQARRASLGEVEESLSE